MREITALNIRELVRFTLALPVVLACCAPPAVHAQQLDPRAFAPNPTGVSFAIVSVGRLDGDVMLDAAAPIKDFEVETTDMIVSYGRTFAIGDRFASMGVALPYVSGDASGVVNDQPREVSRTGLGDFRLRLTANLLPGSALDAKSFAAAPPGSTFCMSLVVAAPTGEYNNERLVNIGSNRWAVKPELGASVQVRQWTFEGSIGGWFFQDNDEFFGDSRKSQDPLGIVQAHVIYNFPSRAWIGFGVTGYQGGRTEVDGVRADDRQENTRAGVSLLLPLDRQQAIKLLYSAGTTTRAGGEFDYFSVAWQYAWLH
jgi:hypothetical protein